MSVEFPGPYDLRHVSQPEGSELCFAAIVSCVSDVDAQTAHQALVGSGISDPDGSTAPIFKSTEVLLTPEANLTIEPVITPFQGANTTEMALANIYDDIDDDSPLALIHKKNNDPDDARHHWVLLTTRTHNPGSGETLVGIMDPLDTDIFYYPENHLEDLVDRSMNYAGVTACALVLERPNTQ